MDRRFLYISDDVVRRLLGPGDAVRSARATLIEQASGSVEWTDPRQSLLPVARSSISYKVKGCALRSSGVAGFRVVGPMRTAEGYETAALHPNRHVLLSDVETGEFFAIVDERTGYALRTGAGAAVAIDALRQRTSGGCSIVGTGSMAYHAALALNEVMDLAHVRVYSRNPQKRERFADRLHEAIGVSVQATGDAEECIGGANVVVTATSAKQPILKHEWLAPGVVVYAMGGGHEWDRECYRRMRVIVEDRDQCKFVTEIRQWLAEGSFDLERDIAGDLGQAVTGKIRRSLESEQFFVRSQGLVSQDVSQALWVYEQALTQGQGIDLEASLVERPGSDLF